MGESFRDMSLVSWVFIFASVGVSCVPVDNAKVRLVRSPLPLPYPPGRDYDRYGGAQGYGRPHGYQPLPPPHNHGPCRGCNEYGGGYGVSQLPHGHLGGHGGGRPGFGNSQSSSSASSSSSSSGSGVGGSSSSATANSFNRPGFGQSSSHAQSESGSINFGPLQATFSKTQSNANA